MANKIDVLYYSNKDGNKSRITRDFVKGLAEQFKIQFDKALDVFSSNIGRRFTERQAYGLFTLALDKINESKFNYVITEFPLSRGIDDIDLNTGRLDYLVGYSNVIYAIELKLAYAGLGGDKAGGERLRNAWGGSDGVVNQLININTEAPPFNSQIFENKTIVKLPVLVVCYYSLSSNHSDAEGMGEKIANAHQGVYENLINDADEKSWQPLFDIVFKIGDNTRETRDNRHVVIHGLGFFAGSKQFEE